MYFPGTARQGRCVPFLFLELFLFQFQNSHERVLWDFNIPNHLQAFLTLLLFFEQFFLTCDVAAITLCKHILTCRLDVRARDDSSAGRSLDGDIEQLTRDQLLELGDEALSLVKRVLLVDDCRERIDRFAID